MHDARSAQRSKRGTDLFGEHLRLFFTDPATLIARFHETCCHVTPFALTVKPTFATIPAAGGYRASTYRR